MGKANIKLNLGTGEQQQRRGHSKARLLNLWVAWIPLLLGPLSTALYAQLAGRYLPQDPQLWGQSLSQPQGRGVPQSIVAQTERRKGEGLSMGSLLRSPTRPCSEGSRGPAACGTPHLDRHSHDLLQAPTMDERLCQRHSPCWANAVP